jgi:hypothetical protein
MRYLFPVLVMTAGEPASVESMHSEVKDVIQRGVLNARGQDLHVSLDAEPVTAAALRRVGMAHVAAGTDGVMALLASRVTGAAGGAPADYGPALEACFAWALVRHSLRHRAAAGAAPLRLGDLFAPYFARDDSTIDGRGNVHASLLPSVCLEFEVLLDSGRRCDGAAWEARCPLESLATYPTALLHHTTDSMGGADIIMLARNPGTGETRPVLLQLRNRANSTLAAALPSVDLGAWYTDPGPGREMPAHAHVREILTAHPQWALPIRGVVGVRPVHAAVLHSVAWLNRNELAGSPVLLMQVTGANIGVDIIARGAGSAYCKTEGWPACLWPTAIRHWGAVAAPLGVAARHDASAGSPGLRVTLSCRATHAAIVEAMSAFCSQRDSAVTFKKRRSLSLRWRTVTATFTLAAAAIAAVEWTRPSAGAAQVTAGGHPIFGVFE